MTNITWLYNTNISKVSQNSQCSITIQNHRINKKEIENVYAIYLSLSTFSKWNVPNEDYTLSSKGYLIIHISRMNNVYQ